MEPSEQDWAEVSNLRGISFLLTLDRRRKRGLESRCSALPGNRANAGSLELSTNKLLQGRKTPATAVVRVSSRPDDTHLRERVSGMRESIPRSCE